MGYLLTQSWREATCLAIACSKTLNVHKAVKTQMTNLPSDELINKPSQVIVAFYLSQRPDSSGRMIEDIWSWNYQKLEYTHDYIQWLFPLKQKSRFNAHAPILNSEVIHAFMTNEELRIRLIKSLKIMLSFYGLQCFEQGKLDIEVTKSDEYEERKTNWISIGNHNYLRLTRILTSLRILGLLNYAQVFFKCLEQIYKEESLSVGSRTYAFWKSAVEI